MEDHNKTYLGDSVYADFGDEDSSFKLYTDNGFGPQNEIYMDKHTLIRLLYHCIQSNKVVNKDELRRVINES